MDADGGDDEDDVGEGNAGKVQENMIVRMVKLVIVRYHIAIDWLEVSIVACIFAMNKKSEEIGQLSISFLLLRNLCLNVGCGRMGNQRDKVFDVKSTIVTLGSNLLKAISLFAPHMIKLRLTKCSESEFMYFHRNSRESICCR